jgi:hypothetical protein
MKCTHCQAEWQDNSQIRRCPFCDMPLDPAAKPLNTVEDVLVKIRDSYGLAVLTDGGKLQAYFSDLAPHLHKHRRVLQYFVECRGPARLVAVRDQTQSEQVMCLRQIVYEMKNDLFVEESAANMICQAYLFALSGTAVAVPEQKSTLPEPTDLTAQGIKTLLEKHHIGKLYLTPEEPDFSPAQSRIRTAFPDLEGEVLLLGQKQDSRRLTGSFLLTKQGISFDAGEFLGTAACTLGEIGTPQVAATVDRALHYVRLPVARTQDGRKNIVLCVACTADGSLAARLRDFWSDVLKLKR